MPKITNLEKKEREKQVNFYMSWDRFMEIKLYSFSKNKTLKEVLVEIVKLGWIEYQLKYKVKL